MEPWRNANASSSTTGSGNDFVVLDRRQHGRGHRRRARLGGCATGGGASARTACSRSCPRQRGVARMVVHNADGSIAEMCGNGLRCAVKYLVDHSDRPPRAHPRGDGRGRALVRPGLRRRTASPRWTSPWAPRGWSAPNLPSGATGQPFLEAPVPGHAGLRGSAVSMGNPHLVLLDRPLDERRAPGPHARAPPVLPGPHQRGVRAGWTRMGSRSSSGSAAAG